MSSERVDVVHRRIGLRRLDHRLAPRRAVPRRGRRPAVDRRAGARPPVRPHRLPPVDGHRPPLGRVPADPGTGRAGRHRERRRRRLQPVPRGVRCARRRDVRAARPPPGRRTRPPDVAGRDLAPHARPVLRAGRGRAPRCTGRGWDQVSKSGGLWAATLDSAGHTCDRVPLAISGSAASTPSGATPAASSAPRTALITNYLAAAESAGVQVRPNVQVSSIGSRARDRYRYVVSADRDGQRRGRTRHAPRPDSRCRLECKVLVLAAGAMGTPPLLMRSRLGLAALSGQVGQQPRRQRRPHRGDRVRPEARVQSVLGLPGYHEFYKGKPITTMSYDWWAGRPGHRVRRDPVHAPGDLPLLADELPLRQRPHRARRSVLVGSTEEAGGRPLVEPDRAAGDGRGHPRRDLLPCRRPAAAASAPAPVRSRSGRSTTRCPISRCASAPPRTTRCDRSRRSAVSGASWR